ncbi:sigma-54-dependent transcriptional regulator [Coralliovum pocilloporae]|uniref:sigma-54-dependent transcriptional regulator n=1 Tax=Coralliovum pocilloporae TaxID=3066369 RepID=UPI00330788A6
MGAKRGATKPTRILIVDTDPTSHRLVRDYLLKVTEKPVLCDHADSLDDAVALRQLIAYDIVLIDPQYIGDLSRFKRVEARLNCPLVLLGTLPTPKDEIAAFRAGAAGLVRKPFRGTDLFDTLNKALNYALQPQAPDTAEANATPSETVSQAFIGCSVAMQALERSIRRIAKADTPVFLTGEHGAGKSSAASLLHSLSPRSDRTFVRFTCGEGDLSRAWDEAQGGTLFLRRITQLNEDEQHFLLGQIDTTSAEAASAPRLISADSQSPETAIRTGFLRADLYYHLRVFPLHIPPLRDRGDDIAPLAEHFLADFTRAERKRFLSLDQCAMAMLQHHLWPGNVRELQNAIRQTVMLHDGPVLTAEMLADFDVPETARNPMHAAPLITDSVVPIKPFWEQERQIIETAITAFGGNITAAANALEISPSTIYRKRSTWSEKVA